MRVKDAMQGLTTVSSDTSMSEAIKHMEDNYSDEVWIGDDDSVYGVVSDKDILRNIADGSPADMKVADIMRAPVGVELDASLDSAHAIMAENNTDHLVVSHNGKPVGKVNIDSVKKNMRYMLGRRLAAGWD